jgi:hypothetical protein
VGGIVTGLGRVDLYRETSLHGFVEILEQLLESVSLRGATRDCGYLSPVTTFLGLVDHNFEFHSLSCTREMIHSCLKRIVWLTLLSCLIA